MCMTEPLFVILSFPAHLPSGAETFFETNCQAVVCAGSIQRVHPKPALYFFFFFFFLKRLNGYVAWLLLARWLVICWRQRTTVCLPNGANQNRGA